MKYASSPAWTLLGKSKCNSFLIQQLSKPSYLHQMLILQINIFNIKPQLGSIILPLLRIGSSQRTDFKLA
jgi:hypothetical protein